MVVLVVLIVSVSAVVVVVVVVEVVLSPLWLYAGACVEWICFGFGFSSGPRYGYGAFGVVD